MRPIGYFTNVMPGDGSLLDDMQETWGSTFDQLSNIDRYYMIYKLAEWLCADVCEKTGIEDLSEHVESAVERAHEELNEGEKLGLMSALVAQIKHS